MSENKINREYKDRLFVFIFGRNENRKWTLNLYNAVNGSSYTDADAIEINTIEDSVYMGMRNDVSFLFHSEFNLYEQQSTYNPNMPLRKLMYLGKLYDKYRIQNELDIYGSKLIEIPVPRLITFYNGKDDVDDRILRLSDAFPKDADPSLFDVDVRVKMINVNLGHNKQLLDACKPLFEYSWLIDEIRKNLKELGKEDAVDKAILDMPRDYELYSFLLAHRAEVKDMFITEYDEAEHMRLLKRDAKEEGREDERIRNLAEMIKNGGTDDDLKRFLNASDEEITKAKKSLEILVQ